MKDVTRYMRHGMISAKQQWTDRSGEHGLPPNVLVTGRTKVHWLRQRKTPIIGKCWGSALLRWGCGWPPKSKLPPHIKFGSSVSKGVHINIKGFQEFSSAGGPPPSDGDVADPLEIRPSPMCYRTEFGHSRSDNTKVIKEIHLKNLTLRILPSERSPKQTQIDPPPMTSY